MVLDVAGPVEPRGTRLTPSREPSDPFARAKSPETTRPTTLVDGPDGWAAEATPSLGGAAAFVSPSGKFDDDVGLRLAPDEAPSVALALLRAALFVAAHVGNGPAPATGARRSRAPRGVRVPRSWWREICAPIDELSAHASNRRPALKNADCRVSTPGVVLEAPEASRDGAVRRGEAAPQRALGLVPAQARGWRVSATS